MTQTSIVPGVSEITFYDRDIERTYYARESGYYERLVAQHGHLSSLEIQPLALTDEQQPRWDSADDLSDHERTIYALYGTTLDEDDARFEPMAHRNYRRDQVEPKIKAQRKAAEKRGVVLNGIRYAGGASNRQALSEAVQAAQDSDETVFARWKDSDGQYHRDHPVSEVEQALRQIGKRRSALINREADHIDAVVDEEADPLNLDWSTDYD